MSNPFRNEEGSSVPSKSNAVKNAVHKVETEVGFPWKSLLTFLGVFGGQLWARATVEGVPIVPETLSGYMALIGGSFVAALGVYFKSNLYTVEQAQQKLDTALNVNSK